jgi:hypothetical protein
MINVTNNEFIEAIFGEDSPWCHVTSFPYDPGNIPNDKHLIAWKGDYFSRLQLQPGTNQYFTISTFYADDKQQARRRKALYRQTHCLVLDDVREKLSEDAARKLPQPSWILETSPGSFQWGYILDKPCTTASKIDNLNDGLISSELAPSGKDPGQRGVTRYVRLPDGYNTKASKMVNGQPFKCQMTLWEPQNRVTLEQLAAPFHVDLTAVRRDARVDGAAAIDNHPLVNVPDTLHIKEIRSDGRFDVTCPWVVEHTGEDDSGAAIFTNGDGTIGFKCHHGACQHRTGAHLLNYLDEEISGFKVQLKNWQLLRSFDLSQQNERKPEISFMAPVEPEISFMAAPAPVEPEISFMAAPEQPPAAPEQPVQATPDAIQLMCDALRRERPTTEEARTMSQRILKEVDDLDAIDRKHWHDTVCDLMQWSKSDFKDIIKSLRKKWYEASLGASEFYDDIVFIKELNQFYDWGSRIFYSAEAFQNSWAHEDSEARKIALQEGRVKKVDRLDYAPRQPRIFEEKGVMYANSWIEIENCADAGDVTRWFDHFAALGWAGGNRDHIVQWMAYTLRFPENKINHMLLLGSAEGCGKDFLLYPLAQAMGENHTTISGEELLSDYQDYLLSTKYLNINETELGDRREAVAISNKLKPLAARPPETLRINQKNIKPIKIRNIVCCTMTTNSQLPIRLNGASRRIFALWSDLVTRDEHDNMKPEWVNYWQDRWDWMKNGGWRYVINYLNQVDLSQFNPDTAPPMTDFLRDIKEASKSPAQQTVESFIRRQHGCFRADVLTAQDMSDTLKAGQLIAEQDMYTDGKYFTAIKVGMVLKDVSTARKIETFRLGERVRFWVIRNHEKYTNMSGKELYREYERQLKEVRGTVQLQAVN